MAALDRYFSGRPYGGERQDEHLGSDEAGALDGIAHQPSEQAREPVVVAVRDVIGLCGGEQDPVDLAGQNGPEPARPAGPEGGKHIREGPFKIAQSGRAGIQRCEYIDEHDLPIEPGEMVAEEELHYVRFEGLVPPLHHGCERVASTRMMSLIVSEDAFHPERDLHPE